MTTETIWISLGFYALGVIVGRFTTAYRLARSKDLVNKAGELLEEVTQIRDEIKEVYDADQQ